LNLFIKFWLVLNVVLGMSLAWAQAPALAFFYGPQPPWAELQAFDLVVVDPDHVPRPDAVGLALPHTRLAAYVALGEVQPTRAYAAALPQGWLVGDNAAWGSRLVDQSQPDWPGFVADQIIQPLWQRGYRSFFLDTLDSYQLIAKTPEARAAQEAGMVAVIQTLRQRFPGIRLIFNRGFEILPQVYRDVDMVVAESLFRGFDATRQQYTEVSQADRDWLLGQLNQVRQTYRLPVAVVDYVPAHEREQARDTARQISALGFTPWVATPDLASLGVGSIEVMPRKVLLVHSTANEFDLRLDAPVRLTSLPLNYLGYTIELVASDALPQGVLQGRYAGVVLWLTSGASADEQQRLKPWLTQQVQDRVPLAVVGPPDFLLEGEMAGLLGWRVGTAATPEGDVVVEHTSDLIGFEAPPRPEPVALTPLTLQQGQSWLTLRQGTNTQVAAAQTPWGGYVLERFAVQTMPGDGGERWVIDPFAFFQRALRLPPMPVPDVSTESGRRMFLVHMDGDGFVSRSELPGNPLAGEVVRDRVVKRYRLPMTLSVIEAELSPQGLYPALSAQAERVAQDIFAQPHVAIASHSYSHPFNWGKAVGSTGNPQTTENYYLPLPGYRFDLEREITGSVQYIQQRLAPPAKRVEMFLWTGDCIPGSDALALTRRLGLLNMNGGDTLATRSQPSLTRVDGLGVAHRGGFQVFAPNQNENVYTNLWTGPFYGYQRVIETFELTEQPRRLKPMNIYFHSYIATKAAGLGSLEKVFSYAMAQPNTPVHTTDYARKVLDFQSLAVARTATGWRIRGAGDVRTLRLPTSLGWPDLSASSAVAGFAPGRDGLYVHLDAAQAELVTRMDEPRQPRLVSANARIESAEPGRLRWALRGYVPLSFTLANAQNCRVQLDGRVVTPVKRQGNFSDYETKDHVAGTLEAICQP